MAFSESWDYGSFLLFHFYLCVCFQSIFKLKNTYTFLKTSVGIIKNLNFHGWLTKHFLYLILQRVVLSSSIMSITSGRKATCSLPCLHSTLLHRTLSLHTLQPLGPQHPSPLEATSTMPLPQPGPEQWVCQKHRWVIRNSNNKHTPRNVRGNYTQR